MVHDKGLDRLLDLDGFIIAQEGGYWVKLKARKVPVSEEIPHGVDYCLTLHDNYNQRVMGFDNAHAPKGVKKKRFQAQRKEYDHQHQNIECKGVPYEFETPDELLNDFWSAVDEILKNRNVID